MSYSRRRSAYSRRVPARRYGGRGFRRMALAPAALLPRGRTGATELKAVDYDIPGIGFLGAGFVSTIAAVPKEGAGFYNRIGRRTRARSLEIRGMISPGFTNAAAVQPQFARVIVLYDRQPNGALPAVSAILADYDQFGTSTSNAYSGLNMDNRDRFLVLRDRKLMLAGLGALGVSGAPAAIVHDPNSKDGLLFHEFIKLRGLETHYKASTGAIGDVATGSFIVLVASSLDPGPNAAWQLDVSTRLKFFD